MDKAQVIYSKDSGTIWFNIKYRGYTNKKIRLPGHIKIKMEELQDMEGVDI